MSIALRHHGDGGAQARVVAQGDNSCRQFGVAARPEQRVVEGYVLHDYQVVVQARMQPHDVDGISAIPCWPSPALQGSNSLAEVVSPHHLDRKPDRFEMVNPSDRDLELLVIKRKVAPIFVVDHLFLTELTEWLGLFLFDLAAVSPPFFLVFMQISFWLYFLVPHLGNPCD